MIKKIFSALSPPEPWKLPVIFMLAVFTGIVLVLFRVSNATSYLSDSPEACMNCHVMTPQYATWQRSSHARVATCNDCHVPQDNIFRKYLFKAMDGTRHATMFTLRMEEQVIKIKEAGAGVVQENCIRCHQSYIHKTDLVNSSFASAQEDNSKLCWDCHRETPHGRLRALSSVPLVRVPELESPMPKWLDNYLNQKK